MSDLVEKLKAWMETDEGKVYGEKLKKQMEEQEFARQIEDKYVEKFHNLSLEERIALIRKADVKYNSDEYRGRYWNKGREPWDGLLWLYLAYGEKYGTDVTKQYWEKYPDRFCLTPCLYKTEEGYYVEQLNGQGSIVRLWTVKKFESEYPLCVSIELSE